MRCCERHSRHAVYDLTRTRGDDWNSSPRRPRDKAESGNKLLKFQTVPRFYWLTHQRCLLETQWWARVHASPHQKDPFAPARAFSILNLPSFSHTEGKTGIVSSGNATSCNFISSSVEGTAGEHDNNTRPDRSLKFFLRDHVQCPSFSPPPLLPKKPHPLPWHLKLANNWVTTMMACFGVCVCGGWGWGWEGTSCSPHL